MVGDSGPIASITGPMMGVESGEPSIKEVSSEKSSVRLTREASAGREGNDESECS